ncbi:ROK family protein [Streptomyces sp. NPDC004284]|uniref:ROK family protein n=1 Tax=Streptomyces sp. NPDC004284 TaxID=3364695 RepID=UPI00368B6A62
MPLGHDVRAGGMAEDAHGAARGTRNALFVAIGTGVAAALVCDGVTVTVGGYAGELGHLRGRRAATRPLRQPSPGTPSSRTSMRRTLRTSRRPDCASAGTAPPRTTTPLRALRRGQGGRRR